MPELCFPARTYLSWELGSLLRLQQRQWHSLHTDRTMKMTKQEQRKVTQEMVRILTLWEWLVLMMEKLNQYRVVEI